MAAPYLIEGRVPRSLRARARADGPRRVARPRATTTALGWALTVVERTHVLWGRCRRLVWEASVRVSAENPNPNFAKVDAIVRQIDFSRR